MSRKFIIDTDTASDDAVALLMAFRSPDIDVKAVTIVAGNVPVEQGTRNALYTAELCGVDVPVYPGATRPLTREYAHAEWFHGSDGLGDQNYPVPKRKPETKHAVDALIDTIRENPGIVLVTLGPLTNVALAVSKAPDIVENVSRCVVMGGAASTYGNVTPAAEYNVWCDPEAARIVFNSGLPVEMVGWELCIHEYMFTMDEVQKIKDFDTPFAHFTVDCNEVAIQANFTQSGARGLSLPDPVAMAVAIDPDICTRATKHYVQVICDSELTRGMTLVDALGVADDTRNRDLWGELIKRDIKTTVVWSLDATRWKEMLYRLVQ